METIYEDNAKVFKAFCDEKRLGYLNCFEAVKMRLCFADQLDMAQSYYLTI